MKKLEVKKSFRLFLLVSSFLCLTPFQILAACGDAIIPCGTSATAPCQFCDIFVLINNIFNFILTCLVPIVAGLMVVLGGLYLVTARGDPGKVNQAKSFISAVVIGIVVIFAAWVFLNTFLSAIGVATWTGLDKWWEIRCH